MGDGDAGGAIGSARPDAALEARLAALQEVGRELWKEFQADVRQHAWHPFVGADYAVVRRALLTVRAPGRRFLEWGSATGVITVMADMLGFEAYGIELDPRLADMARALAERFDSDARFATGSFLPADYTWEAPDRDSRIGTIGDGPPAYDRLGHPLEAFDVVFGYPWSGEEPVMRDLMRRRGRPGGVLLLHRTHGMHAFIERVRRETGS